MDANTYYLNQHMDDLDRLAEQEEQIDEAAAEFVNDPQSEYWPWTVERVQEAMSESRHTQKLIDARGDDAKLAAMTRKIVVDYWMNEARIYVERKL